jgi:hypothetical protein
VPIRGCQGTSRGYLPKSSTGVAWIALACRYWRKYEGRQRSNVSFHWSVMRASSLSDCLATDLTIEAVRGRWELTAWDLHVGEKLIQPLGDHPQGVIYYSDDGWMAVQILAPDRRAIASIDPKRRGQRRMPLVLPTAARTRLATATSCTTFS